jgi:DNA-binding transcriptional ArsR family regulator
MSVTPATADLERDAERFRVLGHETRLRLLALLAAGELAVSEIDAASGIGQPGLSQQLAILRKAELVVTRRVAKQVYYRINAEALKRCAAMLLQFAEASAPKPVAPPTNREERPRAAGSSAGFARML